MNGFIWSVVLLAALVGHAGLHVAIYNRVNSLGLRRIIIKVISKFFLLTMFLIPAVILWCCGADLKHAILGTGEPALPVLLKLYLGICLLTWLVLGIPWLICRPILGRDTIKAQRKIDVIDVEDALTQDLSLTLKARVESKLPLNQLYSLAIEEITLPVAGLPEKLDGYRIAHLSDVHLTGEIHSDFTKYVVEQATRWQPDLMALTGDIIDADPCVDWLFDIFSSAKASDGCYFVLGNHDKRIRDPSRTRNAMAQAGWTDLGGRVIREDLAGVQTLLIGNEYPWFSRPNVVPQEDDFRLLLSHSPDQFAWAREHDVHLMLAGHTHGGQGRLPLAGPILSPSIHGSRYASGDFYKKPTTMHVTRGLCGTHLMRINCRPELSLLTLKTVTQD